MPHNNHGIPRINKPVELPVELRDQFLDIRGYVAPDTD